VVLHVSVDPAIPPQSLENEGDVMKTLTYAAVALAVIAGAAPAMAQFAQPAAPDAATVQAQPSVVTGALDPTGRWMLLQGYGKDGEVNFTWYPVTQPDFSRYHGS
jgi:hypothetical protein